MPSHVGPDISTSPRHSHKIRSVAIITGNITAACLRQHGTDDIVGEMTSQVS